MPGSLEQTVLEGLETEDPNVLRAACILAGLLNVGQAERGLIKALAHKAWQVQVEAVRALGRLKLAGALPFLRRLLKATDADLRQKMLAAAAGTAAAPPSEPLTEGEAHPEVKRAAAVALNRLNPKIAEEALLAALASDQPDLLTAAMTGLANLDSAAGREAMLALLEHEKPKVRQAAAACLGKLRETEALRGLLKLTDDPEAAVRKEAAIALNHLKDKQGLAPLAHLIQDKDPEVRRVAAIALGNTRWPGEVVVEALLAGLKDRDPGVRSGCLKALANVRAADALEEAAQLMADTHEEVKRQAAATVVVLAHARERPDYQLT